MFNLQKDIGYMFRGVKPSKFECFTGFEIKKAIKDYLFEGKKFKHKAGQITNDEIFRLYKNYISNIENKPNFHPLANSGIYFVYFSGKELDHVSIKRYREYEKQNCVTRPAFLR